MQSSHQYLPQQWAVHSCLPQREQGSQCLKRPDFLTLARVGLPAIERVHSKFLLVGCPAVHLEVVVVAVLAQGSAAYAVAERFAVSSRRSRATAA
jgi:hypothetical protein